jgi:WhiB family redox-sensing transcriptional regulator
VQRAIPRTDGYARPDIEARPRRRAEVPRIRGQELAALDWQLHGACRGAAGSVFFAPDTGREPSAERLRRLVAAKRVCARCPVREACRGYALENEEEFGVWGGLSEVERRELIAERRAAACSRASAMLPR